MTTVAHILKKAQLKTLSNAMRTLTDFKGKRVEIEYQKTIATQMIVSRLATFIVCTKQQAFRAIVLHSTSCGEDSTI